jgi:hypothetical protein
LLQVSGNGPSSSKAHLFAHAILLALLFATPALMCVHAACVIDPDLWWHLRTADWMRMHSAVPHSDSFTSTIAGKPWADYSWMFERLIGWLFLRLGLVGIVVYTASMVLAIIWALHRLISRIQSDFSLVMLLTFGASLSMAPLFTPRPWLFTILFFVLVVDIVMHARTTGRTRELAWLPLIFALWANLHIQFVVGLVVVAIALLESILARWWTSTKTQVAPGWMLGALVASLAATCANPYGWRIFRVVYELATAPGGMNKISELQAMAFRDLPDWGVLLFALAAAAVLSKSRQLPFETALLMFAAYFSFRSQRDVWVLVVVAVAIVACAIPPKESNRSRSPDFAIPLAAMVSLLLLFGGFRVFQVNNSRLGGLLANSMPVEAVRAVKLKGFTGPLYNDFNWGGYLMWSLRMPVTIDGRGSLYGDTRIDRSVATWNAAPDWANDPQLTSADLVIGPVKVPLSQLLRLDPHWQIAYEDNVAVVFVRRK